MPDQRSAFERALWERVGPPLYYCGECLRAVRVEGDPVTITRPCTDCGDAGVIAPRKAIAAGEGGLNFSQRATLTWWQVAAAITGRCV